MAGIAFWGSKTGQKQGGCCLNARTAKTNRKTTHTLKHMLKLRKFATDWMLEKKMNYVQKPPNRALNIGKNTRVPIEGIFRGVRPYKRAFRINNISDWRVHVNQGQMSWKRGRTNACGPSLVKTFWLHSWRTGIRTKLVLKKKGGGGNVL